MRAAESSKPWPSPVAIRKVARNEAYGMTQCKQVEREGSNRGRSCSLAFNTPSVFARKFKWRKWDLSSRRSWSCLEQRKKSAKTTKQYNLLRTFSYSLACLSGKWDSVIKSPRFLFFSFFLHFMHLLQIWAVITIKHFIWLPPATCLLWANFTQLQSN